MDNVKVGIIGHGFVGGALHELLKPLKPVIYDKFQEQYMYHKAGINACDIAFVCVPTPMKDDKTCDLSAINEVLLWCHAKIVVIKSTVPVGTTARLSKQFSRRIVHNPEFLREVSAAEDMKHANRTILGGDKRDCLEVCKMYQKVYDHNMQYVFTTSDMSEFVKYATNSFFATKVAFCNELYDICNVFGLDYDEFREYWLLEPRVGRHHTQITEQRGYGGTCLPKDLNALIKAAEDQGYGKKASLLKAVWNANCQVRKEFQGMEYV